MENIETLLSHLGDLTESSRKTQEKSVASLNSLIKIISSQNNKDSDSRDKLFDAIDFFKPIVESMGDTMSKMPVAGIAEVFHKGFRSQLIEPMIKFFPNMSKLLAPFGSFLTGGVKFFSSIGEGFIGLLKMIPGMGKFIGIIGKAVTPLMNFIPKIFSFLFKIVEGFATILGGIGELLMIMSIIDMGLELISTLMEHMPDILLSLTNSIVNMLANIVANLFVIIMKLPMMLMDMILAIPKFIFNILMQIFNMAVKLISTYVTFLIKLAMAIPMFIISSFSEILTTVVDTLMEAVMNIADLILDFIGMFIKFGIKIVQAIVKFWAFFPIMILKIATKFLAMMFDLLFEIVSEFMSFIVDTILAVPILIVKGITKLLTAVFNIGDMVVDMVKSIIETIFKAIFAIPILFIVFSKLFSDTGVKLITQFAKIIGDFFKIAGKILMPMVNTVIDGFIKYFPALLQPMKDLAIYIGTEIAKWIKKAGDRFFAEDGPFGKYKGIWDSVTAFIETTMKRIDKWMGALSKLNTGEEQIKFIGDTLLTLGKSIWDYMRDPLKTMLKDITTAMINDVLIPSLIESFPIIAKTAKIIEAGAKVVKTGAKVVEATAEAGLAVTNPALLPVLAPKVVQDFGELKDILKDEIKKQADDTIASTIKNAISDMTVKLVRGLSAGGDTNPGTVVKAPAPSSPGTTGR